MDGRPSPTMTICVNESRPGSRVRIRYVAAAVLGAIFAGAVGAAAQTVGGSFAITSTAFAAGGAIPSDFTCDGADRSPPLSWRGVPAGTRSLALIVDDPDAPDPAAPQTVWVHWVLFDIPPTIGGIAENGATRPPAGASDGRNDWGNAGWGGPCPPVGRHRYFFRLYALDTLLGLDRPDEAALQAAMRGHVIAQAQLIGTYARP
jgi:Raf kinase inhibitor-like YbhB/YbcL family protein